MIGEGGTAAQRTRMQLAAGEMTVAATVDHEINELKREFLDEAREKVDEMRRSSTAGAATAPPSIAGPTCAPQLKGSGGS